MSHKKDNNLAICDNMVHPWSYAKRNKSEKDEYCMISLVHRIWKKNKLNQTKTEKQTWRYKKEGSGYQSAGGEEGKMGEGDQPHDDKCKLYFWWWACCSVYGGRK